MIPGDRTSPVEGSEASHDGLDGLVDRVVGRDPDALAQAYERTVGMLSSIAFGIVRDRGTAEDVVQDVFVRLVGAADTLHGRDGRALRAWLVRAVRNRSLDVVRSARAQRERPDADVPDVAVADTIPGDRLPDPEIAAALDELTPDQRDALLLFHVAGLTGQEVAAAMDRSRAAVYRLLRRGERAMRAALAGSDPGRPDRPHHRRTP